MKRIQIAPDIVPRLPVLGWGSLGRRELNSPPTLLDSDHIRHTTSGRAAIGLALQLLQVGRGDRVLVPTYHCPTMVAPAAFVGAEPVFFPIDATGGAMLAGMADREFPRVKAMIAAHYFGIPQPMRAIREFCDSRGIMLIEDCAHAVFGESDGRAVGAWGDIAIASTPKFFATPNGGWLVSRTRSLDALALASQGFMSELREAANMLELGARFRRLPGLNGLLSGVFGLKNLISGRALATAPQAMAVDPNAEVDAGEPGGAFDPELAGYEATRVTRWVVRATNRGRLVTRRRENYRALAEALAQMPGTRLVFPQLPESAVPYVLPIWIDNPDDRYYALKHEGIPVFRWDWLWTGTPVIPGDHGRRWSRHIFQFPCHQDLTAGDIDLLAERIRAVFAACPAQGREAGACAVGYAGAQ